jgi:hypothetical protein
MRLAKLIATLLTLAAVLMGAGAAVTVANGQCWGTTIGGPVGPLLSGQTTGAPTADAPYEWLTHPNTPDQLNLYRGGKQVGALSEGIYRPIVYGVWGPPSQPPIPPPPPGTGGRAPAGDHPTGVVEAKVGQAGPRYWYQGHPITKAEARNSVGDQSRLVDDRQRPRITAIGTADQRKPMDDYMAALPPADRGKVLYWSVPPDHWSVKDTGWKLDGGPTIYVTAPSPDGGKTAKVLWREDGPQFSAGALLAKAKEYDHRKDPGPKSLAEFGAVPPVVWLLAVVIVLVIFVRMLAAQSPPAQQPQPQEPW